MRNSDFCKASNYPNITCMPIMRQLSDKDSLISGKVIKRIQFPGIFCGTENFSDIGDSFEVSNNIQRKSKDVYINSLLVLVSCHMCLKFMSHYSIMFQFVFNHNLGGLFQG